MPRTIADPDRDRLQSVLDEIADAMAREEERGTARPPLAGEEGRFAIAVDAQCGVRAAAGDVAMRFPLQSVSKAFALLYALEAHHSKLWERVGREPSGDPFNSIVDLERHEGYPRNPFINAGALVVCDALRVAHGDAAEDLVRDRLSQAVGEALAYHEEVLGTGEGSQNVNRALAHLSKHFDNLEHSVDAVLRAYVRQCAVALDVRHLARAGRALMVERVEPGQDAEAARRVRRINALMLTCGQYDGSGEFAYRVGLPAKSGVSGAILAIVPNVASVAVWSPGIDAQGNSKLGTQALGMLSERMDWSVFGAIGAGG